ncbi:APC family permease [Kitasatospora sp. CB02891]|uniref:APC family permease n=1 Tax=Kitasatospora sp. CB02891 TaxID=2020329 RepID=UPI001E48E8FB|nr:APC family permease [Kitasatospora sp. CB02891]
MATTSSRPQPVRLLRTFTTPKIVFMIIAAAAPLAAMLTTVPLSFSIGNGPGVPALFVFAGLTLLCFSSGYAAISSRISHAGGFYTYIAHGMGRPPAVSGGIIAVIAYNTVTVGVLGAFAYFAQALAASHGLNLPWEVWAAAGLVVVGVLGYRHVELSARVLAVLMICEIVILFALDVAILARHGFSATPAASFAPHNIFAPGFGVSMMFGMASFIGFESAGLYAEETRNPERSVPRATIIAVVLIATFYGATSWLAVGAVGPSEIQATATADLGDMFFNLSDEYLNSATTTVMQVLLCTSVLGAWLALHNAANRYMFVLGRDGLLPGRLAAVHPKYKAIHRASVVQTVFSAVVVAAFALAGLDPYLNMSTSMLGIGTLGIVVLQAMASVAVLGYYRKRKGGWWQTRIAPVLGAAGLVTAAVLVVRNFAVLTGTTNPVVTALPWALLVVGVGGLGYAYWIRSARPERYAALAQPEESADGPAVEALTDVRSAA